VLALPPSLTLSLIVASGYGALFHALFGRRVREIPLYIVTSIVGFFVGSSIAYFLSAELPRLGDVPIFEGSIVAWGCLFLANRLVS
jgi:hypothetical protein